MSKCWSHWVYSSLKCFYNNETSSTLHRNNSVVFFDCIYCHPLQVYKSFALLGYPFQTDQAFTEERDSLPWIKIIEYNFRNKLSNPFCDLPKGRMLMIEKEMQWDNTPGRNTAHDVKRPSFSNIPIKEPQLIQNANITGINFSPAICQRMEQKCLLFFFTTLRSNL